METDCSDAREKARSVLAEVLGLSGKVGKAGNARPEDDEDFYLLGGTSLMASIAVEVLRENGFNVNLSTLIECGKIGPLLDLLVAPDSATKDSPNVPEKPTMLAQNNISSDDFEGVRVEVFVRDDTAKNRSIYEEALELVSTEFDKREMVGIGFGLIKRDHANCFEVSSHPDRHAILFLATYEPTFTMPLYGAQSGQLVGVILAVPRKHVVPMVENPNTTRLQHYMDYLESVPPPAGMNSDNLISTIMAAVRSPEIDPDFFNYDELESRWNRLKLYILIRLEQELLQWAKRENYSFVDTANLSVATKEACMELGYDTLNTVTVGEYAKKFHIDVDPNFHHLRGYYMVKRLV